MKKLFFLIATFVFSFMDIAAQEFAYDGLKYYASVEAGTCVVAGYEEGAVNGHLVIPSEAVYNGHALAVTIIDAGAFSSCTSLTSVDLPGSLIDFPAAFDGCTSLESVKLNEPLKKISVSAFSNCYALSSIEMPESLTEIGMVAFNHCTSLTSVKLPESLEIIEDWAFSYCSSLSNITLPDNISQINERCFIECTSLAEISLPANLVSIENNAFAGCSSLKQINFPNTLELIDTEAFAGCSSLEQISGGFGIKTISDYAFYNCSSLKEIMLPSNLQNINSSAFQNCTSLYSIYFERSDLPVTIGYDNFKESPITSYIEERKNIIWRDPKEADILIENWKPTIKALAISSKNMLGNWSGSPNLNDAVIMGWDYNTGHDDYIRSIPDANFASCPQLSRVDIFGVDTIGANAFAGCPNLEILNLDNIEVIGAAAFADCFALKNLGLPNTLKRIEDMAFALNSLESAPNLTNCFRLEYIGTNCFIPYNSSMRWEEISIPGSVLYLARDAIFGAESVTLQQGIREIGESAIPYIDIENLTVENIIPPIISEYNFFDSPQILTVPEGSREAYASTAPWCNFKEIREEKMTLLSLGNDSISVKQGEAVNLIEAIKPNLDWNYYIYSPDSEFEIQYDYDNTAYWGGSLQQGKFSLRIVAYDGYGQVKAVDCIVTVTENAGVENITTDTLTKQVRIYDINGMLRYSGKLDEANLAPGLYIAIGNGITKKIIIK